MKELVRVLVDAAKETPRLYFAPLLGAFNAVSKAQDEMVRRQREHGEFGRFEARHTRQVRRAR